MRGPAQKAGPSSGPRPDAVDAGETNTADTAEMGAWSPSEEDIRVRAYHRYLERGGSNGMDFEDWLEAERELRSQRLKS
jgi:hypothetical protein